MNGWSPEDYAIPGQVSGVVTNQPITREFPITAGGASVALVIKIKLDTTTHVGTQTLKLQTAMGNDWVDSKSTTFSADGIYYIKLLAANSSDQTYFPLLSKGRVVLSQTNAGDSVNIISCEVLEEL